jgi:hypothetical protein
MTFFLRQFAFWVSQHEKVRGEDRIVHCAWINSRKGEKWRGKLDWCTRGQNRKGDTGSAALGGVCGHLPGQGKELYLEADRQYYGFLSALRNDQSEYTKRPMPVTHTKSVSRLTR